MRSISPSARRLGPGRLWALSAGLVALVVIAAIVLIARPGGSTDSKSQAAGVPLGVFRQTDSAKVAAFETWLGRPVNDVVDFSARSNWNDIAKPDYLLKEWQNTKYRLIYAVPMLPTDEGATMDAGATGAYDAYFTTLAEGLVKTGQPNAILRIGWEFNLSSWPWSIENEKVYVAYFRHIVTAMRSVPGQRFQIDWNVNNGQSAYDAQWYYPGDDVVDSIGVDAYDVTGAVYPYPANCDAACRLATQKKAWAEHIYGGDRGLKYWAAFAKTHGKPMSLPEWGLWQRPDGTGGGDDPYYLQQMYNFITDKANNVSYQAYFEFNYGADGSHSLEESFPASARLYRKLFGG
jgi:hypothetical protein